MRQSHFAARHQKRRSWWRGGKPRRNPVDRAIVMACYEMAALGARDAEVNSALHEFTIGQSGIVIAPDSSSAENILAEAPALRKLSW